MSEGKPIVWLRIEAADEARCDSMSRLNAVIPDWKIAKKELNDCEEALLDAQTAARQRFPDEAYDEETSKALNRLTGIYETNLAKHRRLDSRKRSLQDELRKLTDNELAMISEAREPGIFAEGMNKGPNAWKAVELRDLVGGPDKDKPLDKQVWASSDLEEKGIRTVHDFIKNRRIQIANDIDGGELAADTIEKIDTAVYRFLEKRDLVSEWPKGVDVPDGEQMQLIHAGANAAKPEDDDEEDNEGFDGPAENPSPSRKPGAMGPGSKCEHDIVLIPNASTFYDSKDDSELWNASNERYIAMRSDWAKMMLRQGETAGITPKEFIEINGRMGSNPVDLMGIILGALEAGAELPNPKVDDKKRDAIVSAWMGEATRLGHEDDSQVDEFTEWFAMRVCQLGGDAVRKVSKWNGDLGSVVAAHQENSSKWVDPVKAAEPAQTKKKPTTKKKPAKKKAAKKKPTPKAKSANG